MSRVVHGRELEPDATYHVQVKAGASAVYERLSYGARATLQVPGRDVEALLKTGSVELVEPDAVPDVAER